MNKVEAIETATRDLEFYRAMPYAAIVERIGETESFARVSNKEEPYQIEFEFFYDDAEERNIRVSGMVSYSLWTDFSPVGDSFIMAPDGTFIDE